MKIPKEAKKVFEGILFDVYHWEQEMYDGSYQTFEKLCRKPSVDIIALVGDEIIVLEQEQPDKPLFPSLPGGKVEENETDLDSAKRELVEETGYSSDDFFKFEKFFGRSKIFFPEAVFVAKNCKEVTEQKLDPGEKIKVKTIGFDDFLQLCRNPKFTAPMELKFMMYEALVSKEAYENFKNKIYESGD